jgi:hypothetical protein
MLWAAILLLGGALPAAAQVTTIDPNTAIDSDISPPPQDAPRDPPPTQSSDPENASSYPQEAAPPAQGAPGDSTRAQAVHAVKTQETYNREDVVGAAEGVFGKGASGLSRLIENVLRDQGEPNAYIAGSEGSGAVIVGLRYGSGTMFHKVEGQRPVYWTGPSVGFDIGGDANKVFVLVYNLYDSQDLYKRFPQGEGHVYVVGGFSASYLRRGNVVLIPVRLGVGWRVGINAGYMKFREKRKWLPF